MVERRPIRRPEQRRQPPRLRLFVDGVVTTVYLNTSTEFQAQWVPGTPLDLWVASKKVGSRFCVEWELSTRSPQPSIQGFAIEVPGETTYTKFVGVNWPAGRRLCGRIGAELELVDAWQKPVLGYHDKFGPLEMRLPTIWDKEYQTSWAADRLAACRTALATGGFFTVDDTFDGISVPWIGPFPCYGQLDPGPGAPGGWGIYHSTGWQDNVQYARLAAEMEAMAMCRMWCFYNADGSVFSSDQFPPNTSPYCSSENNNKPVPFNAGSDGLPYPISLSHYTRVMRYVGAACEMTDSLLARRHMISLAETGRLMFSERSILATLELGSGFIAFNLRSYENRSIAVGSNAKLSDLFQEMGWDRNQGWLMWCVAWAKKLGMPWTAGWQDWSQRILACMIRNQMVNGIVGRVLRGDVSTTVDIAAAMHECLLGLGILALSKQTGIATPGWDLNHAKALFRPPTPSGPYSGAQGVIHFMAVGTNLGAPYATITSGYGEPSIDPPTDIGDPSHNETYLAAMYARTGDARWLANSLNFGTAAATLDAKRVEMMASTEIMKRSWEAYLLGILQ